MSDNANPIANDLATRERSTVPYGPGMTPMAGIIENGAFVQGIYDIYAAKQADVANANRIALRDALAQNTEELGRANDLQEASNDHTAELGVAVAALVAAQEATNRTLQAQSGLIEQQNALLAQQLAATQAAADKSRACYEAVLTGTAPGLLGPASGGSSAMASDMKIMTLELSAASVASIVQIAVLSVTLYHTAKASDALNAGVKLGTFYVPQGESTIRSPMLDVPKGRFLRAVASGGVVTGTAILRPL